MGKSIERRIKLKAILIYLIIVASFAAIVIYINALKKEANYTQQEIEFQDNALSITNKLIAEVENAQTSSGLYISKRNRKHLNQYFTTLDSVEYLIDTIAIILPTEEKKLIQLYDALQEQAKNVINVGALFSKKEPYIILDEELKTITKDAPVQIINKVDTIITENSSKKGFFKRLGEAFKPPKDTTTIIINSHNDTIISPILDTSAIFENVEIATQKAEEEFTTRMRILEDEVTKLVNINAKISSDIFSLLLDIHNNALKITMILLKESDEKINKNYNYLTILGTFALVLTFLFMLLILSDINRGREARKNLEQANIKIKNTMESRHKLLLAVSHDIKTPLNSIIGYLDLMEPLPDINSMKNSSMHILSMLENLLEYSSLEQGSSQKNFIIFNLKTLVNEIYEMFYPIAKNKNLKLTYSAKNIRINSDRVKIKQIIINLVSNAIKYTKEGSITLLANIVNNELIIEVTDTGVGIPKDKINNIFKPFVRIEENNHLSEGSGLGMYVVNGIIKTLNGKIDINSEIDKGSKFTIHLPIEFSTKEIPSGEKTIQIYDDDPTTIKLITTYLHQLGHKISNNNPDIIITDMEMGDINGIDILKQAGEIPVIVMTGRGDFSLEKATLLGFSGYIAKPFSYESIKEVIGIGDTSFNEFLLEEDDELMEIFKNSTKENIAILNRALTEDNFNMAQAVCHKMFPMFAQFKYPTEELKRMDSHKNNEYNGWQNDIKNLLKKIEGIF